MMLFIFKGFEELNDVLVVQMLFMLHEYEPLFANCKKKTILNKLFPARA